MKIAKCPYVKAHLAIFCTQTAFEFSINYLEHILFKLN